MRRLALILYPTLALLACSDDGIVPELASSGGASTSGTPTTADPGTGDGTGNTSNNEAGTTTAEGGTTVGPTATTGDDTDEDDTGGTDPGSTDTGSTGTGTGTTDTDTDTDTGTGTTGGSSSSDGGMMVACPETTGTSLIGGPADLYGYCWYITAPMDTCDSACSELAGGANLALLAESSYVDNCDGPIPGDVPTWFFDNGNPAGWTAMGGSTSGHTLGYGYSIVGQFYGKCSTGTTSVGTYPGEAVGGGLETQRQLICACAEGTP